MNDLKERINRFRLFEHFKSQRIPRTLINEIVEKALFENSEMPGFKVTSDVPPLEELFKIVELLLEKGYDIIPNHYLPLPDKSDREVDEIYEQQRKQGIPYNKGLEYSSEQSK